MPELPARTYADRTSLLEDPEVRVVSIATEPATHAALTVEALEAGKPVIVEKSLALTSTDARRVMDTAVRTRRVGDGGPRPPAPPAGERCGNDRARGASRPLRTFALANHAIVDDIPPSHWFWDEARSGRILLEHGVHFFDLAARLAGSPAREIAAFPRCRSTAGRTERRSTTHASGRSFITFEGAAAGREPLVVARKKPRPRWRLPFGKLTLPVGTPYPRRREMQGGR